MMVWIDLDALLMILQRWAKLDKDGQRSRSRPDHIWS